ncbi:hypothetical protein PsorP6_009921 [Peronosclerospora sorghi]|uniref:Uncharacterized protein n=1 Tax=Peronosclerospora sorghi TaxID=230839 RepID=A0ACC0VY82_9STRA|nr:hypothetical protein PsorP6_009921 [Peronosclerospora sorghi]
MKSFFHTYMTEHNVVNDEDVLRDENIERADLQVMYFILRIKYEKAWNVHHKHLAMISKNKEIDDRIRDISSLDIKLSSVQAQIHTVTTEKAALETKLTACETVKQKCLAAASGVTASWEKDRHMLKAQLELEPKNSTQLKDFNARLMSGLKILKKENGDLKDPNATNAEQPVVKQKKHLCCRLHLRL